MKLKAAEYIRMSMLSTTEKASSASRLKVELACRMTWYSGSSSLRLWRVRTGMPLEE